MALFKKNSEVADLKQQLVNAQIRIQELSNLNSDYKNTIEEFMGFKMKHDGKLKALHAEYEEKMQNLRIQHDKTITKMNNDYAVLEKSVNRKVNIALQNIGVNAFAPEIVYSEAESTPSQIYRKFVSMPNGNEKNEYFKQHETTISSFMKQNK